MLEKAVAKIQCRKCTQAQSSAVPSSNRWATHPKEARNQLLSGSTGGVLPLTNMKFMLSCTVSVQPRKKFESPKLLFPYSYKHDHLIKNASIPWCDLHESQGKKHFVQILLWSGNNGQCRCVLTTAYGLIVFYLPFIDLVYYVFKCMSDYSS